MSVRLLDAGDCAVTVEFGDRITGDLVAQVGAFERSLAAALARGELAGVVELVPTFRSLTVLYDPLHTRRALLEPALLGLLQQPTPTLAAIARRWRLPVCYEAGFGADLADVAAAAGLSPEAVVQCHSGTDFNVYMLGFMPGFAFMGDLPSALAVPRRKEPRLRVPAGSVAITGGLSAIYPWESPGGWRLLGRCPVPLFDAAAAAPALLAPGDRVRFEPVSADRFAELERQLRVGTLASHSFMEAA
ncbi:MAG: allophanate hydrolase [Methylibium sp. NZG]|nr:MAG: allophanate hydrolase [Methylibium sp. NZG]